jgi:glycolate oxidase
MVGTGHVGDGNVHLSLFQSKDAGTTAAASRIIGLACSLGGAVSGEHGIGVAKRTYLESFEDPSRLELLRSIRAVFDPLEILNPGTLL